MLRLPEVAPGAFFLGHVGWSAVHRQASASRPHTHPQIVRLFSFGDADNLASQSSPLAVPGALHVFYCGFWHLNPPFLLEQTLHHQGLPESRTHSG